MESAMMASKPDSFILAPVSAQARLKRNRSELPLKSRTQPRIVCDLILETIQFSITDVCFSVTKCIEFTVSAVISGSVCTNGELFEGPEGYQPAKRSFF